MASDPPTPSTPPPGLKKIPPYWYPYTTMAKGRWLNREILEVVSTEFRDRSMEYYRYALESGVTTVNGKVAKPDTIIRNGDRIENVVHRHEPPITSTPVRIIHHDKEREFIVVDKPGSIPVHASGRYFRNTLVEILQTEFGIEKAYTVNRLDRLTSGLLIIPLTSACAAKVTEEFVDRAVRKEYVARVKGEFPKEEIICDEPMLTVDRQIGLNIVHPDGKPAKTIFNRIRYDANTDTSVIHCQPLTGRSHQLRVHLQYLGHPIANDPLYSEVKIWGPNLGKNGIDLIPSSARSAPAPPAHLDVDMGRSPESLTLNPSVLIPTERQSKNTKPKLLPRETGHDIGLGSPVPLSEEAVGVITRLRNMKDEDEDWSRWRDVVFRAKGRLSPIGIEKTPLPPQNRRKRGGPGNMKVKTKEDANSEALTPPEDVPESDAEFLLPIQLTTEEALAKITLMDSPPPPPPSPLSLSSIQHPSSDCELTYCPECYLPLHPDPKPERLYIFLHALRYTTSLGCFETEMPDWASEGWVWDRGE